jgi:hypothetical protein
VCEEVGYKGIQILLEKVPKKKILNGRRTCLLLEKSFFCVSKLVDEFIFV